MATTVDPAVFTVPSAPESVVLLRRSAEHTAYRWGVGREPAESIEACVSELATNAILHGDDEKVVLGMTHTPDGVVVEVIGNSHGPVIPRQARSSDAEDGRGLLIVAALAKDWGTERVGDVLRVWALIAC